MYENTLRDDMDKAANSIALVADVMDGIGKAMKVLKVAGKLASFASSIPIIGSFLAGFSAIFSIFGSVFGDSVEVQKLDHLLKVVNVQFKRMEQKLEFLERRVGIVEDTVKREHFWTRISPELKKLYSVKQRVMTFYDAKNAKEREQVLVSLDVFRFKTVFDAFLSIEGTFDGSFNGKTLCDTLSEFSKVDLDFIKKVLIDLYIRLLQASSDLIILEKLHGKSTGEPFRLDVAKRLVKVQSLIQKCEKKIMTETWKYQWKQDIGAILEKSPKESKSHSYSLCLSYRKKKLI